MSFTSLTVRQRFSLTLLISILSFSFALNAQTTSRSEAKISQSIDDDVRMTLRDGIRPEMRHEVDLGVLNVDVRLEKIVLLLKRSPNAQTAFDRLTSEQQNPHSSLFHHWLTPDQIGQQFGVAVEERAQIVNWLQGHGFQIDSVARSGLMILFSGTESQLEAAFHTSMHSFRNSAGKIHVSNVQEPSVPATFASVIVGIASLNDYPVKPLSRLFGTAHMKRGKRTAPDDSIDQWQVTSGIPTALASNTSASLTTVKPEFLASTGKDKLQLVSPFDFATIYNVAPLWNAGIDGTGETIAVLAESDIDPQDVASFRSTFGLPANPVNIIYVGANPGKGPSEVEAALDAEWSGAVAKNATIDVVVAQDTRTSNGLVLGAYEVIDNNLASVLSVSWGACEYELGNAGNQLFSAMWEQAAAQGITVVVASGDAGSATCDQGSPSAADFGLTVNGFASTPYNLAVGGTDLYGTYTNPSKYWSSTNDPVTLKSALDYINELPWNDTCGSPQYLTAAVRGGQVSDTTNEQFCNDQSFFPGGVAIGAAGGGGVSACIESDGESPQSCSGGYPIPVWQSQIAGAPYRVVPDIALFAGNGLWGAAYVFCQSDATPDGTCNDASSKDLEYLVAGGTSFGTPAFAGIIALIDQKTASRQGNAAPILYELYNTQITVGTPCDTGVAKANSSCIFQDISTGSNAEPCDVGSYNCTAQNPVDSFAVLGGYSASTGFDPATGLGSVNAANLASSWPTGAATFVVSQTSFKVAQTSLTYGSADDSTVTVAAASGTPTGDVGAMTAGFGSGPFTLSSAGSVSFPLIGLPTGTHTVTAHYAGDGTFAPSDSIPVSITVNLAATRLTAHPSLTALAAGDSVLLSSTVISSSQAASPTGMIKFTDVTSGAVLATAPLSAANDSKGNAAALAQVTVQAHELQNGTNSIVASYAGDINYLASSAPAIAVTYNAPFALSLASSTLNLPALGSADATVTITSSTNALPAPVFLACPQTMPPGLACAFSPAVLPAGSKSATSVLTVYASSALERSTVQARPKNPHTPAEVIAESSLAGTLLLLMSSSRRRRKKLMPRAVLFGMVFSIVGAFTGVAMSGCGSSSTGSSTPIVKLAVSSPLAPAGTAITFTATVTDPKRSSLGTAAMSFVENGVALGKATLNEQGVAALTTSLLSVGPHSISATYPGGVNELSANSTPVTTDITFTTSLLLSATDSAGDSSNAALSVTVK